MIVDSLAAIGCPLSNDEIVSRLIFFRLGPYYMQFCKAFNAVVRCTPWIPFMDFFSPRKLINNSIILWSQSPLQPLAHVPNPHLSKNRSHGGRFPPHFSKNHGHSGNGGGQGKGASKSRVCNHHGHSALTCHHHFNPSYQLGSSSGPPTNNPQANAAILLNLILNSSSFNWYPDLDATHHITHDLDTRLNKTEYDGPDKVHLGDGSGSSISATRNIRTGTVNNDQSLLVYQRCTCPLTLASPRLTPNVRALPLVSPPSTLTATVIPLAIIADLPLQIMPKSMLESGSSSATTCPPLFENMVSLSTAVDLVLPSVLPPMDAPPADAPSRPSHSMITRSMDGTYVSLPSMRKQVAVAPRQQQERRTMQVCFCLDSIFTLLMLSHRSLFSPVIVTLQHVLSELIVSLCHMGISSCGVWAWIGDALELSQSPNRMWA
ncbi:uncharacterized protein A4U43_C07F34160 [Asparagus officinalis]|uniref:Uncharacterized protein n=1 Tax=Asparagus officinalis TaxID=4686 RepID=A0A5P1EGX1_ASPOF|nr:uncharacterized protein A4U43_C07F34160 [Asparagus officinalis]